MTLQKKWIHGIYQIVTGDESKRQRIAPVAGTLFFGSVVIFMAISLVLDNIFEIANYFPIYIRFGMGAPLVLAGLHLMMWSVFTFADSGGTPVAVNPPPVLVTTGPYKHIRNPMLAGIFLLMFGIGFLLSSFTITLIFTPLFIIANVMEVKYLEEPELELRLGQAYRDYKARTTMFIPRLWRKSG